MCRNTVCIVSVIWKEEQDCVCLSINELALSPVVCFCTYRCASHLPSSTLRCHYRVVLQGVEMYTVNQRPSVGISAVAPQASVPSEYASEPGCIASKLNLIYTFCCHTGRRLSERGEGVARVIDDIRALPWLAVSTSLTTSCLEWSIM